jgi:hypothetical protein
MMFRTANQTALNDALDQLHTDQGGQFTAGYATQLAVDMLNLLPKRKQKEFIRQVEYFNGCQLVTVKNCLTGKDVTIHRADKGTVSDPSQERYHTL